MGGSLNKRRLVEADAGRAENDVLGNIVEIVFSADKGNPLCFKGGGKLTSESIALFHIAGDHLCSSFKKKVDKRKIGNTDAEHGGCFIFKHVFEIKLSVCFVHGKDPFKISLFRAYVFV